MKAIGYIRVSTEGQAKDGVSLDNQKERIKAYCLYKGFELVEIIEDAGISGGKNKDRDGFNHLLDMIEEGRAQTVVLYSLERLSRDMLTLLALERLLDEYDIALHTIEGEINTSSPDGFMNFAMKAFLGEMERRQIKHRTKKAMEYKKAQGEVVGAIPFGHTRQNESLIEDPKEQAVIAMANRLYSEGQKVSAITREINQAGHTTRNGKAFSDKQIVRMIEGYETKAKVKSAFGSNVRSFINAIA